jgi:hypothetical protein
MNISRLARLISLQKEAISTDKDAPQVCSEIMTTLDKFIREHNLGLYVITWNLIDQCNFIIKVGGPQNETNTYKCHIDEDQLSFSRLKEE